MNYKKNITARIPTHSFDEIERLSQKIFDEIGVKIKTSTLVRVLVIYALRDSDKIILELTEDDHG